jgi:hypothetical protein
MIAILLRQRMYLETNKYRKLRLGSFKFAVTRAVINVADRLYDLLLEKKGEPQLSEIGPLVHALAHELLVYSSKHHKIGGPSDFVLMLQSLRPDGRFENNASVPTRACAQLQYILRSIFIHCRRVKKGDYTPVECVWESAAPMPDEEVGVEGDTGGPQPEDAATAPSADQSNTGLVVMEDDDPISLEASIDIPEVTKSVGQAVAFMDNDGDDDDIVG